MRQITDEEIKNGLATLPARIARLAQEAEDLKLAYDKQRIRLKAQESDIVLTENKSIPKQSVTKLKEIVNVKLKEEHIALLDMESAYRKKLVEVTKLDNEYTGYKRIAQIRIVEIQSGIGYKGK